MMRECSGNIFDRDAQKMQKGAPKRSGKMRRGSSMKGKKKSVNVYGPLGGIRKQE